MTQLERIASNHRVATRRDACGDAVIPGKNGHLYTDDGAVMVCFTDDGRPRPFPTKIFKTRRLDRLRPDVIRLKQVGDYEFIAQITDSAESIETALFKVLGVKRLRTDYGIPRPIPEGLREAIASRQNRRPKIELLG